jgi:8-oxo-dGTP pyrophosphatase MutT (NUDIX family)
VSATVTLRRLGYRVAYRLLQVFWFITRPTKRGVKCVVTDRDRVLLVRHTYGRRSWDVPGGSMKRSESPLSAARREMSEELGLDGVDWTPIGELHGRVDRRHDTIHCFRVELSEPDLRLDLGELATAGWFDRSELPDDRSPYVDEIVAWAPEVGGAPETGGAS